MEEQFAGCILNYEVMEENVRNLVKYAVVIKSARLPMKEDDREREREKKNSSQNIEFTPRVSIISHV